MKKADDTIDKIDKIEELEDGVAVELMTEEDLGQLNYAAYASKRINEGGLPLPPWAGLTELDKKCWCAGGTAIYAVKP